jgi:hypothetical protein
MNRQQGDFINFLTQVFGGMRRKKQADTQTDRQKDNLISLLNFFQIKERGLEKRLMKLPCCRFVCVPAQRC